ncbi:MAG: LpxL/LpxP family Kdo(2)-lipid IV(A) lauroyl/palmitoleoyl acyltransferase [Porticoccaceae bacterium]
MASQNTKFKAAFLHPRYWGTWFWLGLWRLVTILPFRLLLVIGELIGFILYLLPTRRKKIARINIQLCFPELDSAAQTRLLKENFRSMGIALMEVGMAWWWSKHRLLKLVSVEGLENLQRPSGEGVILLGMHFTTLEIGGAALTSVIEIDGMYKSHTNPVYDYIQLKGRLSHNVDGCSLFDRKDMRGTLKSLKDGRVLWYLPDQDYGLQQGLFAPFFGIQAATVHATSRMAKKANSVVIPVSFTRLPGAKGYKVTIETPLDNFPSSDKLIDATRINQIIEKHVRRQPEQYLWVHRRFKNRPNGEKDYYNSSSNKV